MPLRYGAYNSNYRSRTALAMFNGFQGVFCNYEFFGSGDFFLKIRSSFVILGDNGFEILFYIAS